MKNQNILAKKIWFDARNIDEKEKDIILSTVYNSHIETLLIKSSQIERLHIPSRLRLAVYIKEAEEIERIGSKNFIIASNSISYLRLAKKRGYEAAFYITIKDKTTLDHSLNIDSNMDYLIVKLNDETNIPLELVIATFQNNGAKVCLLKEVLTAQEAAVAFGVMEVGSDGILLSTKEIKEILQLNRLIDSMNKGRLDLVRAKVKRIEHIGMGDRACVDTTTIMEKDEGMIVGSTSTGGILVCSEVHPLPYMNTRPFRVNAGAVHSYIWGPNNKTEYLTDLKTGSKVVCATTGGMTRIVSVGRVKIEVRPLLLIEVVEKQTNINIIMQDDWHVRVFGTEGKPKNITNLKCGDEVLAHICEPGRHVGIKVDEKIREY